MIRNTRGREAVVELELGAGRPFDAVSHLVVGGVATRAELPVDRVEDLQLSVDALLLRRPAGSPLSLRITESDGALRVTMGPYPPAHAGHTGLERIVGVLVDEVLVQDSEEGEWISTRVDLVAGDRKRS